MHLFFKYILAANVAINLAFYLKIDKKLYLRISWVVRLAMSAKKTSLLMDMSLSNFTQIFRRHTKVSFRKCLLSNEFDLLQGNVTKFVTIFVQKGQ